MNDMKKPPRYLCKPLHGYATEINSKVLINNESINVEILNTPQNKQTNYLYIKFKATHHKK